MSRICCPIKHFPRLNPDNPALVSAGEDVSYGELEKMIGNTCELLSARGIESGQRIGILSDNSREFIIVFFALLRLKATICPVNWRLPVEGIIKQLNQIACPTLITDLKNENPFADTSIEILLLEDVITLAVNRPGKPEGSITAEYDLAELATIIFSSGSTGKPKAIAHTFGNHYYNALGANENIPLHHGDRWLLSLPIYHVGGLAILFRCMIAGAAIVIDAAKHITIDFLIANRISHLSLVPTQLRRLCASGEGAFGAKALKCILVGGDVIDSDLIQSACDSGLPLVTTYGSTEMASQITATCMRDTRRRLKTCGRALNYRELKITEKHEILVKGQTLFDGFVRNEEIDNQRDDDGWHQTGDLGALDDDGYLTLFGRYDNMFISGGENIYPEEIESHLNSMATILISVVIPIPDDEFGCRPAVFIRFKEDMPISIDEIVSRLRDTLPGFKIPVKFFVWPKSYHDTDFKLNRLYFRNVFADHLMEQMSS